MAYCYVQDRTAYSPVDGELMYTSIQLPSNPAMRLHQQQLATRTRQFIRRDDWVAIRTASRRPEATEHRTASRSCDALPVMVYRPADRTRTPAQANRRIMWVGHETRTAPCTAGFPPPLIRHPGMVGSASCDAATLAAADISGENRVTSLDTFTILQAEAGAIGL